MTLQFKIKNNLTLVLLYKIGDNARKPVLMQKQRRISAVWPDQCLCCCFSLYSVIATLVAGKVSILNLIWKFSQKFYFRE